MPPEPTPAAAPTPAPAPAAGLSKDHQAAIADNARLKAEADAAKTAAAGKSADDARRVAEAKKVAAAKAGAATGAAMQKQIDELTAAASASDERAAAALVTAKNALRDGYLGDLKKSTYAALAPAVELGEGGGLTDDSVKALEAFRKDNPDLFKRARGTSPMGGPNSPTGPVLNAEDAQIMRALGHSPSADPSADTPNPYGHVFGYGATVPQRGI